MKNLVRLFALSLVATGAFASTQISPSAQPASFARVSALPVPMCPPDGSTSCGMGTGNGAPGSPPAVK